MRHLPEPQNLREAVKEVIRSNSADRYHPGRFIQATEAGEAKDLKRICEHMILNPDTLTWLVDALRTHGSLLFLEDLVAEYGYGLSPAAIEEAQRRARALDELVGGGRWKSKAARVVPQAPTPQQAADGRLRRIAEQLLKLRGERGGEFFWPWLEELEGRSVDKKRANKFLLGCILDWQIHADRAWENARRLAEDVLGDPEDLWGAIAAIPLAQWMERFNQYSLHRFQKGHERVWTIGRRVLSQYRGDARNIWKDVPPSEALSRLEDLGVGEQISRMVVGALMDTGQIEGIGDVKPDRHVCRVLGRILEGSPFQPDQVVYASRQLSPENPWLLDRPLYLIGKEFCFAQDPNCPACPIRAECKYYASKGDQARSYWR